VTRLGWWPVRFLTAFAAFLTVFYSLVATGQRGGDGFFDNLWLALPILAAGLSGVLAGAIAALAIVRRGERSLLAFLALIVGLLVGLFWLAEVAGHE
jgi:hypothetical protein